MGMNYQSSLTGTFTKIIILATITTLVPYAFAAAAQLMLMFKEPERFSGRRLVADATIAILAFGYSFWMIYGAGQEYIAQGFLLLLAGIPVYVYLKWRQAVHAESPVEAERPAARPAVRIHHGAFGSRAK
jgi:APA family basic amino acid/polyamine antiporter